LLGEDQRRHEYLYWEYFKYNYNWKPGETSFQRNPFDKQALRIGEWKAVRTGLSEDPNAPIALYNLIEDIGESRDIAEQHPELVQKMQQYMGKSRFDVEYFNMSP